MIPVPIIDIAMIDADCFFAADTFEAIRGRTNAVFLDDVRGYKKNSENHDRLSRDAKWEQLAWEPADRHGWSAFRRRDLLKAA